MQKNRIILLISSIFVFPFTLYIYNLFPDNLAHLKVYIYGMGIYWLFIGLVILVLTNGKLKSLKTVYINKDNTNNILLKILPFLPVFGVFFISFLPNISNITITNFIIVIIIATINGTIEETYWRGLYLREFENNFAIGFIYSSICFGMWHISLWYLKGIIYHGGILALVGGAFIMGLLWSYSTRQLKNIKSCIFAHILVNIFAFTGLFIDNNF